jgi:hypothetical protein
MVIYRVFYRNLAHPDAPLLFYDFRAAEEACEAFQRQLGALYIEVLDAPAPEAVKSGESTRPYP